MALRVKKRSDGGSTASTSTARSGPQEHEDAFYDALVDRYDELREWATERHSHWRMHLTEQGLSRGFPAERAPTASSCLFIDEVSENDLACYGYGSHACTFRMPYLLRYPDQFDEVIAHENVHAFQRWVYKDCEGHGDVFLWLLREWCEFATAGPRAKFADPVEAAAVARAITRRRRFKVVERSKLAEALDDLRRVQEGLR